MPGRDDGLVANPISAFSPPIRYPLSALPDRNPAALVAVINVIEAVEGKSP